MQTPQDLQTEVFEDASDSTRSALQGIVRFLRLLVRRKQVVGLFLLATFALGVAYYSVAPRYYASVAKLMISVQKTPDRVSSAAEQAGSDNVMASQRELIRSSKVVQAAIERLAPEHRADLADTPPKHWVETVKSRLSTSTVRNTNHMAVNYQSRNPEAAAAVVTAVINSYLEFVAQMHRDAAGNVLGGQHRRLAELEQQLAAKQQRLTQLRNNVEAITSGGEEGVVDPVVSEAIHLHKVLMEARQEVLKLQASQETINQALRSGADLGQHMGLVQEAVGEQVLLSALGLSAQDGQIQVDQQKQLLKAEDELRRISPYLGEGHPRTIALQKRIDSTKQFLSNYRSPNGDRFKTMSNAEIGPLILNVLQQSLARARAQEQQVELSYRTAFQTATRKSSDIDELTRLQREVELLEADRHNYDKKIADVDINQLLAPISATIVQDPIPNDRPASPRLRNILLASIFSGLMLGALVVYVQDLLDDRFDSPESMASQLGLPVLSLVRMLKPTGGTGIDAVQMHVEDDAAELEAFRTLRTALTLSGEPSDRLAISSAEPSDGKTTVSANLAVSFAQVGKRTLMIDADLRRPGMTALMDLKGKPGVTDLLLTDESVAELAGQVVRSSGMEGLDVIPAGPRRPDPAELLARRNFEDLLAWADANYDQVLVDCPPVLAVSDAQIVGRLVDGVVVVVSPEKNHRRLVVRACESFLAASVNVFGVVANRISDQAGYGYGYGYGYSYGEEEPADELPNEPTAESPDIVASNWDALVSKAKDGSGSTDRRAA